jgi:hypothetical protein
MVMRDPVKKLALTMAAVFALTILVYLNSLSNTLLWDDTVFVTRNPFISDCSNLKTALNPVYLAKILPVRMGARPLVNISLLADTCSGSSRMGMRVTNIVLHACNSILVMTLAYVLAGGLWPAALAGLLFGMHPLAAEPVAIVTFRSQLLCVFFYLSALLTGIIYLREKKPLFIAVSALAALAAMLSNEAGITYPLAFALLYLTLGKKEPGNAKPFLYLSVCAAVALLYFWFRIPRGGYDIAGTHSLGYRGFEMLYPRSLMPGPVEMSLVSPGVTIPKGLERAQVDSLSITPWMIIYTDWKLRLFTMTGVFASYLGNLLLPLGLKSDYNPPVISSFIKALPGFSALAAAGLAAFGLRRKAPLASFGILLVFAALLPVTNLIPIYNIKADRYLYLSLAGWALAAAALAEIPGGKARKAARLGLLFYAAFLGSLTFLRNPVFKDGLSFFSDAAAAARPAPRALINLAKIYFTRGEKEKAREQIQKALAIQDNYQLRLCWAEMEMVMGSQGKSEELARAVLKEDPANSMALYLLELRAMGWKPSRIAINPGDSGQ